MELELLKKQILSALEVGSESQQSTSQEVLSSTLRQEAAQKIGDAVKDYFKTSLINVLNSGTPVPQDGGSAWKIFMIAKLNTM